MSNYAISDGRVRFTAPGLFEISLTLTGPDETDYWYAVDTKLLVKAEENILGMAGKSTDEKATRSFD